MLGSCLEGNVCCISLNLFSHMIYSYFVLFSGHLLLTSSLKKAREVLVELDFMSLFIKGIAQ